MNNDYLWDKTGDDEEVKGLETLLSGLKYQPTAPPMLPIEIKLKGSRAPWWRLSFAIPPCLLIAVLAGFWMTRISPQPRTMNGEKGIGMPLATNDPPRKPENPAQNPANLIAKAPSPKTVTTHFTLEPERRRRNIAIKVNYRKRQTKFDTLTSEERFAYDQLMLALSITGSKLRVVSDKINPTED